jgi:hypothetical protein
LRKKKELQTTTKPTKKTTTKKQQMETEKKKEMNKEIQPGSIGSAATDGTRDPGETRRKRPRRA